MRRKRTYLLKIVDAPGVEGRGTTGDFVVSREVSCEKEPDSRGKLEGADAAGSVSLGLMQPRRTSSEVSKVGGVVVADDSSSAACSSLDNAAPQVQATNEDVTLRGRWLRLSMSWRPSGSCSMWATLSGLGRCQALAAGVSKHALYRLRNEGRVELLSRGLYRNADEDVADLELVEIARRAPMATLCLTTALARHGLSDEIPQALDVALPRGTRTPVTAAPVAWHHTERTTFELRRKPIRLDAGTSIGIYSAERCIVDAFRTHVLGSPEKARQEGRPTDELLQLLAPETFLDRLSTSAAANDLVLKGGVLLAAYDMRRPTRDVDLSARGLTNSVEDTVKMVRAILKQERDDGWTFGLTTGEDIREDDEYGGVRATVVGSLATARVSFHLDINFGDPIWPAPSEVIVPRLLGGTIAMPGYSVAIILAEKIVTALQRGTANTRWRDFADIYLLSRRHSLSATELSTAIYKVAAHRQEEVTSLSDALDGFATVAQARWSAWVRRQRMQDRPPLELSELLDSVLVFTDPLVASDADDRRWDLDVKAWL